MALKSIWDATVVPLASPAGAGSELTPRACTLAEYRFHLHTDTNSKGRPYAPLTVARYLRAAERLNEWMIENQIEGDFGVLTYRELNGYFAERRQKTSQNSVSTLQNHTSALYSWLELNRDDYDSPWSSKKLGRYSEQVPDRRPLPSQFIHDLLIATGGGRSNVFIDARDHAILRCLLEGLRVSELTGMELSDVGPGFVRSPVIQLIPLKGARDRGVGRRIAFAPKSAKSLLAYVRVRSNHPLASLPELWLPARGSSKPLSSRGVWAMTKRRCQQAGYATEGCFPHIFRHTASHQMKELEVPAEVSKAHFGWADDSSYNRYGAAMAEERAIAAKLRRGDIF